MGGGGGDRDEGKGIRKSLDRRQAQVSVGQKL